MLMVMIVVLMYIDFTIYFVEPRSETRVFNYLFNTAPAMNIRLPIHGLSLHYWPDQ